MVSALVTTTATAIPTKNPDPAKHTHTHTSLSLISWETFKAARAGAYTCNRCSSTQGIPSLAILWLCGSVASQWLGFAMNDRCVFDLMRVS